VNPRRERGFLFEKWYLIGTQMGGTPMVVPNKYYKYLIGTTPLEMVLASLFFLSCKKYFNHTEETFLYISFPLQLQPCSIATKTS
jgi:hypothetical protein